MGELGEIFEILREENRIKRAKNLENSLEILRNKKIDFTRFNDNHLRIGAYDFWPTTGLFINRETKKQGRGIFSLLEKLGIETNENKRRV